jgi:hypothetical protein
MKASHMSTKRQSILYCIAFLFVLTASAVAERYDDLAKWAEGNKANARQFLTDLSRASGAHEVALAIKARGQHERDSADTLIEIVHRHPELRYLPELSLDNDAFRKWAQKHPEAAARRSAVPKEALTIAQRMRLYLADLFRSSLAARAIPRLSEYLKDPEVATAKTEHQAALKADERRMMQLFQ